MARFPILILSLLAATAALSGCGQDPSATYAQAFGFSCANTKSAAGRTACLKGNDPGAAQVSRYCYKTLADANCFDRPDPDSKNQALGSAGY